MNKEKASEVKTLFEEIVEIDAILSTLKEPFSDHFEYLAERMSEISHQNFSQPHIADDMFNIIKKHVGLIADDLITMRNRLEETLKNDY